VRDRSISLEDQLADEGISIDDELKVGSGFCWIDETRTCSESCMAFNRAALDGEHPCLLIQSALQVTEPIAVKEDAVQRVEVAIQELTRAVQTVARSFTGR
jgi:hypothetical protein